VAFWRDKLRKSKDAGGIFGIIFKRTQYERNVNGIGATKKPSPSGKGFELLAEIYGKSVVVKCG
jgi:hypothetical protein